MRLATLTMAALVLAGCNMMPGSSTPPPAPERTQTFVAMVEGAGCELHQEDNDALLDPAGFSDAEASAISRQLISEGRAEITPEGDLLLLTENCV